MPGSLYRLTHSLLPALRYDRKRVPHNRCRVQQIHKLSEPQNHRCCYCGHRMLKHVYKNGVRTPRNAITRDHITPRTHGGTNQDNLVAACSQCNGLRGDMDAIAFFNRLQRIFKRNPELRVNWHELPAETLAEVRRACLDTQERRLRGLAVHDIEFAFLHLKFLYRNSYLLRA